LLKKAKEMYKGLREFLNKNESNLGHLEDFFRKAGNKFIDFENEGKEDISISLNELKEEIERIIGEQEEFGNKYFSEVFKDVETTQEAFQREIELLLKKRKEHIDTAIEEKQAGRERVLELLKKAENKGTFINFFSQLSKKVEDLFKRVNYENSAADPQAVLNVAKNLVVYAISEFTLQLSKKDLSIVDELQKIASTEEFLKGVQARCEYQALESILLKEKYSDKIFEGMKSILKTLAFKSYNYIGQLKQMNEALHPENAKKRLYMHIAEFDQAIGAAQDLHAEVGSILTQCSLSIERFKSGENHESQ